MSSSALSPTTLSDIQHAGASIASAHAHVQRGVALVAELTAKAMLGSTDNKPIAATTSSPEELVALWKQLMSLDADLRSLDVTAQGIYHRIAELTKTPIRSGKIVTVSKSPNSDPVLDKPKSKSTLKRTPPPKAALKTKTPASVVRASAGMSSSGSIEATDSTLPGASAVDVIVIATNATSNAPVPVVPVDAVSTNLVDARETGVGAPSIGDPQATPQAKPSRSRIAEFLAKHGGGTIAAPSLHGNPARLMAFLNTRLNHQSFATVSQVEITKATGLPAGSINAAMKKLLGTGLIQSASPPGDGYRLVSK